MATPTSWLEPGNLTVVNWLSLYRSKAGAREEMISLFSVKAWTSVAGSEVQYQHMQGIVQREKSGANIIRID